MAAATYILCPGQGAQAVGMAKELVNASPAARDLFDSARSILGWDVATVCFEGPLDKLNQTDISQPTIYVTSIASYLGAIEGRQVDAASVTAYAGLSLGEYTALHLAGVFSFEAGLRLVAARGKYMQEAAVATPSGMVALIGGDEAAAQAVCAKAAQGEVLVPANFNAPGQIVVSGSAAACQRVLSEAEAAGLRATPLKVAGAFHSPLMQSAADRMKDELAKVDFAPPKVSVYSNVTARPHTDAQSMKDLLVAQIVQPVRWEQTMTALLGTSSATPTATPTATPDARFVELAPGRTLAGLAKRINRRLAVESLDKADRK